MKINRRDFIKTGGMVMLGSLAVPSFLGSCTGNKVDRLPVSHSLRTILVSVKAT